MKAKLLSGILSILMLYLYFPVPVFAGQYWHGAPYQEQGSFAFSDIPLGNLRFDTAGLAIYGVPSALRKADALDPSGTSIRIKVDSVQDEKNSSRKGEEKTFSYAVEVGVEFVSSGSNRSDTIGIYPSANTYGFDGKGTIYYTWKFKPTTMSWRVSLSSRELSGNAPQNNGQIKLNGKVYNLAVLSDELQAGEYDVEYIPGGPKDSFHHWEGSGSLQVVNSSANITRVRLNGTSGEAGLVAVYSREQTISCSVINLSGTMTTAQVGKSAKVQYELQNTGNTGWTFYSEAIMRRPDGSTLSSGLQSQNLSPNTTATTSWSYTPDRDGNWDIRIQVWRESSKTNILADTGWKIGYVSVIPIQSPTPTPTPNLLRGIVPGTFAGTVANSSAATDGDSSTFATLTHDSSTSPNGLVWDLRQIITSSEIEATFEAGNRQILNAVEISTNSQTWTTLVSRGGESQKITFSDSTPRTLQYIRWSVTQTDGGPSRSAFLFEIKVTGSSPPPPPAKATVSLASRQDDGSTSSKGAVNFDYRTQLFAQKIEVNAGNYNIEWVAGADTSYTFVRWETEGGVSVSSSTTNPSTVTVSSSGTLKAIYKLRNKPPTITGFAFEPSREANGIVAGSRVKLTVRASDPEGDQLTYRWLGNLPDKTTTEPFIVWDVPTTPGRFELAVHVSDGKNTTSFGETLSTSAPPTADWGFTYRLIQNYADLPPVVRQGLTPGVTLYGAVRLDTDWWAKSLSLAPDLAKDAWGKASKGVDFINMVDLVRDVRKATTLTEIKRAEDQVEMRIKAIISEAAAGYVGGDFAAKVTSAGFQVAEEKIFGGDWTGAAIKISDAIVTGVVDTLFSNIDEGYRFHRYPSDSGGTLDPVHVIVLLVKGETSRNTQNGVLTVVREEGYKFYYLSTSGEWKLFRDATLKFELTNQTTSPSTVLPRDKAYAQISPDVLKVAKGDRFLVTVLLDPKGQGISSAEVTIAFDPAALTIESISPGALFGQNPLVGVKSIDNPLGKAKLAVARQGPTRAPTASGSIAEVQFTVKPDAEPKQYAITINNVSLSDENARTVQDVEVRHGLLTVVPPSGRKGDANGDGKVNFLDLAILGAAYGTKTGEGGYNASADFNNDGVVDFRDLAILGAHYEGA